MSALWWRVVIFGVVGIFAEVVFTAILDIFKNRRLRLHGFSFLWMFPIYGLLAFLFEPVRDAIDQFPVIIRGLLYMTGIFVIEFVIGSLLTAITGTHIWHYTDRFNIRGQITLLYVPVWFAVGLVVEQYYPWVERLSRFLAANS